MTASGEAPSSSNSSPPPGSSASEESLLVALSSYAPRAGQHPTEDFLTEAFAWMLKTDQKLSSSFIKEIEDRLGSDLGALVPAHWETQASLADSRPDMLAEGKRTALAFEHKIRGAADRNQLACHQEGLSDNAKYENAYVVLITSARWEFRDPADVKMTWADVYQWLDGEVASRSDAPMIRELQSLLEDNGLAPRRPIDETALRAYLPVQETEQKLDHLIDGLESRAKEWDFLFKEISTLNENKTKKTWKDGKTQEGRLGIRFMPWEPGIYIGIMVDGKDHKVELLDPDRGPDLIVVLDVGKSGVGDRSRMEFLESDLYSSLVSRVKSDAKPTGWDVVDTHGRPEEGNEWHPLILRQPLVDVLQDASTLEDHVEQVVSVLRGGVEILIDDGRLRRASSLERPSTSK